MFRKWLLTVLGVFGFFVFVVGVLVWVRCPLPEPAVEGYVVHSKLWNNHGISVEIYPEERVGASPLTHYSTKTNVNGYFSFFDLPKGEYRLGSNSFAYAGSKVSLTPQMLSSSREERWQSFSLHLFSLISGLIVLGFGFLVFHHLKNRQMAAIFLVMTGAPACVNLISFLQFVLAYWFHEIAAAEIFPIAYSVFLVMGPAFVRFFMLFPRKTAWADKVLPAIYAPSIFFIFVIFSWMAFGNDRDYAAFWGISYIQTMLIVMILNSIYCLFGLGLLVRSILKENDQLIRQKLIVMSVGLTFGICFFIVFLVLPVMFYDKLTPFPGYYNVFTSLAGLIIFGVFCFAILRQKLIDIGRLVSRGVAYFLATSILVLIYGLAIVLSENFLRQYSQNTWFLGLFVVMSAYIFTPLRNGLQLRVDRWFGKDPHLYRQALMDLAKDLPGYLEINQLKQAVLGTIQRTMKVQKVELAITSSDSEPVIDGVWALILPLETSEGLVGKLFLGAKEQNETYDAQDQELLSAIAGQAAIALRNAQLYAELRLANEKELVAQKQADHSARLASLGTISAGLAHELKNPLSALHTMTKLLQKKYDDAEFRQEFLDIVPRQVERMNELIISLLDFAKPQDPVFKPIDLKSTLQEVLNLTRSKFQKLAIEIELDLQDKCLIEGDERLLMQVFLNLVLNAIDSMPEGGNLEISLLQRKQEVIVKVKDSGKGIPQAEIERIFDPFYTTKPDGTGLGLSTTWRIVKEHKATIEVSSTPGQGTLFTIKFPSAIIS